MRYIDKSVRYFLAFMMAVIIYLILLSHVDYVCKNEYLQSNIILLILDFILFLIMMRGATLAKKIISGFECYCDRLVLVITIFLFCIEMYIAFNIHFMTGWDAGAVWENAYSIAFSDSANLNNYYYSQNPNNLLITSIGALVLKINSAFGVFIGDDQYLSLIFINCVFISTACFMVYKILNYFVSKFWAFAGFILSVILIGLSPWMVIYYSDTLGLLFPVLIIYIFIHPVHKKSKNAIIYIIIYLLSSLGYYIKPQILIVTIAIFIIQMCYGIFSSKKEVIINILIILGMVLCLNVVGQCLNIVYEKEGFLIDNEARFGMTHYFMMGLNEERNGVWAEEDVFTSSSCQTAKERRTVNIDISIQRLKDFGILGYARHLSKKILCTFNDGTFAWRHEGRFFLMLYNEPNTQAAAMLRSFYYEDGQNLFKYMTYKQSIWIFILLMVLLASLWYRDAINARKVSIIMLSIIGIIVFELLFEVRARYLFAFTPLFCIIAIIGARETWTKINNVFYKLSVIYHHRHTKKT